MADLTLSCHQAPSTVAAVSTDAWKTVPGQYQDSLTLLFWPIDLDNPKDLEVGDRTETTLSLRWRRPVAKFDRYRLTYVSPSGKKNEVEIPVDSTSFILRGLEAGTEYTISLVAEKGRHKSKPTTVKGSTGE